MSEELLSVLMRFHREVVMPDMERLVDERIRVDVGSLRNEMLTGFDAIYKRFDRLETEYYSLVEAVRRVEERLTSLEASVSALADRMTAVEDRMTGLEHRMTAVEGTMTTIQERVAALQRTVAGVEAQVAALRERMASDDEIDRLAVRSEIDELKEKVRTIKADIVRIEAQL